MARKPKHETNEQFIARLVRFSKHGALMQIMMLDGLHKFASKVAEMDPDEMKDNPLVSGESWKSCGAELRDEIEKHLGTNTRESTHG